MRNEKKKNVISVTFELTHEDILNSNKNNVISLLNFRLRKKKTSQIIGAYFLCANNFADSF